MPNIENLTPGATSTPQEAASNIQNAQTFSLTPVNNEAVNKPLASQVDQLLKPTEASPAVHEYMSQSTEHTSLALGADKDKPGVSDVPVHNFMDETTKYIGDIIYNRPTDDQKVIDLANKKMSSGGNLSDEDTSALWKLNEDRNAAAKDTYNEPPSYPAQIGQALLDTGRQLRRNGPLIAGFTGVGAGIGAFTPFGPAGAVAGAAWGLSGGITTAFVKDTYESMKGGTYNELDNAVKLDGTPMKIDEATKSGISQGVGIITGALMGAVGHTLAKTTPFLNNFITPKLAKNLILNPANAALLKTVMNIGEAGAVGSLAGGAIEATKIIAEEMGKTYDGTQASFLNALSAASDNIKANSARIAQSALVGGGTAATIAGVTGVTGFGKTKAGFEAQSAAALDELARREANTRDVTPPGQERIAGARDVTPIAPETPPQIGGPQAPNSIDQSVKVLKFQDAMHDVIDASKETKAGQLAPGEMSTMIGKFFERAGISKLYTTVDSLRKFGTDQEKGKAALDLMDSTGKTQAGINATIELDPMKVMDLAQKDPSILAHIQVEPNGPSAVQAKDHLENLQKAAEDRVALFTKLGIGPKDIAPEAEPGPDNVIPLGEPKAKSEVPFDVEGAVRRTGEILQKLKTPAEFPRVMEGPDGFMGIIPKAEKLPEVKHTTSGGTEITLSSGGHEQSMESGVTGRELKMTYPTVFAKDANGKVVGHLSVKPETKPGGKLGDPKDKIHVPAFVEVDKAHRGKGVASALYQYANAYLAKIDSSEFKTDEGKKFAEKFNYKDLDEKSKKMMGATDNSKLETELADIKSKVADHFKKQDPGKLLIGDWSEPTNSASVAENYLKEPTFTEAIQKALPAAEVEKFNTAQQAARQSVVDNIKDTATHEMNQVQDMQVEQAKDARLEMERQRIANDPNYAIVDKIRNANKLAKTDKTLSIYAIDPKTLPNNLLKLTDNARLKEYGIFKKGGTDADSVATLLGVKDGAELLQILAKTPTREQVAKARAAANAVADEGEARASVDLDHTGIIRALNAEAANHVAEMKFMREQEWPATKGGIKRIALPLPPIEELAGRARDMVINTKVGSLNPNTYRVGERQSMRIAVNAILKNEGAKAFQAKENATVNVLALKETHLAIARVNRALTFMRKLNTPTNKAILRAAGKDSVNALKELTDLFNFKQQRQAPLPVGQVQGPTGDFLKWATKEVEAGRGDFSIPERLTDIRQDYKDMTVEQFLTIADRARVIFSEAKTKNQLIKQELSADKKEVVWNTDRFAEKVVELKDQHPGKDVKRIPEVQDPKKTIQQQVANKFASAEQLLASMQYIIRELDKGELGGFFHLELQAGIAGSGRHYEKGGFTYVKKQNAGLDANLERLAKAHGDVDSLENKFLDIPEFHGIKELNNGILTKGSLAAAQANLGQQYTKDMLTETTGGVSSAKWQEVLDRELTTKDVEYVQGIVDLYKDPALRAKTMELQKKEGREVTFIEGIPYVHKGVTYSGGYVRVRTVHNITKGEVEQQLELLKNNGAAHYDPKDGKNWGRQYSSETTHQGYLVSREGNSEPLHLSLSGLVDGLREIIHDHGYREVLKDFFTKVNHPDVESSMIQMVGQRKYNNIVNTALEIAGRPSTKDSGYFADAHRTWTGAVAKFGTKFTTAAIWGNYISAAKVFTAIPEGLGLLGPKGMLHFAHVNLLYLRHLDKLHGNIASAMLLDPNIGKYMDQVGESTTNTIDKWVPKKGQRLEKSLIGKAYEGVKTGGFLLHQWAEVYAKSVLAHTTMKSVLAGDHPNYPLEKIQAMSPEEQFQTVQTVVQQVSELATLQNRHELKAPLQKTEGAKPYTYFWNFPRNIINNNLLSARQAKWKTESGLAKIKASVGDDPNSEKFKDGMRDLGGAASIAMGRLAVNAIGGLFIAWLGKKGFQLLKKEIDWADPKSVEEAGMHILGEIMAANGHYGAESLPIVNNMQFAIENKRKYKMADVKDVHEQGLTSLATCMTYIPELLTLSRYPDRMQMRACLESLGYVVNPVVTKGYFKAAQFWEHNSMPQLPQGFHADLNTAKVDGLQKDLKDFVQDPGDANKALVAQADALHQQLAPVTVNVPQGTNDAIKMAESGGQWEHPNGLYGFNSSDWKGIMHAAPELGLTENGRIAKDTTQQEKAMDWSLKENAGLLAEKDLPVNQTTLYGAHVLGVENYEKVFKAPADTKLKTILGNEVLSEHPEIGNFKTIGQVKSYFNSKIEQGRKALETDNNLTSKTTKNED